MNYTMTFILPLALLVSGCDGGGSSSGAMTTSSGRMPANAKAGSAPAQTIDPNAMTKRPPIGNQTAPATGNTAAPAHP